MGLCACCLGLDLLCSRGGANTETFGILGFLCLGLLGWLLGCGV